MDLRATVVGSGPNGLAAAITLAEAGVEVSVVEASSSAGGGMRSSQLTVEGLIHDDCSAFHPAALISPFFRSRAFEREGLRWAWPEIQVAHPLEDGRAALLHRELHRTAVGLEGDAEHWTRTFERFSERIYDLAEDALRPILHQPRHPSLLARFGARSIIPAKTTVQRWNSPEARALFGGIAAHAFSRLDLPMSSAVGLMLGAAAQSVGWPVAVGGSASVTDAMVRRLEMLGGSVVTGVAVTSLDQLGMNHIVMLDTSVPTAMDLLGRRLGRRRQRSYRRFRSGPAALKIDLAIEGPIPWTNLDVGRAGTVHLGGSFEETARSESLVSDGVMPTRPFVLVGQQYLADPSRSVAEVNPVWVYAHVPNGYSGEATAAVLNQIERFAPGFHHQVRSIHVRTPADLSLYNANYVGGDIGGGANSPTQLLLRPRPALNPYRTGAAGVYLCSSSTPPGGGVHGMCGHNAALSALNDL